MDVTHDLAKNDLSLNAAPADDLAGDDLIVIPARYGSSRLPGKPLMHLAGRSLLERVIGNARSAAAESGRCTVLVATDDPRIANHAASLGVDCAMTASDLDSGTARARAAARQMGRPPARIINLQGDAPFIPASIIAGMLKELRDTAADVITPVFQLSWDRLDRLRDHKRTAPFSGTTCIRATDGRALWFSKTIIPAMRNEPALRSSSPLSPVWQHLGIYGYTMRALDWCATAPTGQYEALESLEQLRFIEGGWRIQTIAVEVPDHLLSGIDTAQDLARAEEAIARFGDPFPA